MKQVTLSIETEDFWNLYPNLLAEHKPDTYFFKKETEDFLLLSDARQVWVEPGAYLSAMS